MTALDTLPPAIAIPAALLVLAGAGFTLVGSIGLVRLRTFYERVHAPTLGTSLGLFCILWASMLVASALQARPVLHELVIGFAVLVTTPITLMLLARAALYRDRATPQPGLSPVNAPPPPRPGPPSPPPPEPPDGRSASSRSSPAPHG